MERLDFKTSVLGEKAAGRLRRAKGKIVTFRKTVPAGSNIEVYLDDELLGSGRVATVSSVRLSNMLNTSICLQGGFDTPEELEASLKKAGFRAKPLNEYFTNMLTMIATWGDQTFLQWKSLPKPAASNVVRTPEAKSVDTTEQAEPNYEGLRRSMADALELPAQPFEPAIWKLRMASKLLPIVREYFEGPDQAALADQRKVGAREMVEMIVSKNPGLLKGRSRAFWSNLLKEVESG